MPFRDLVGHRRPLTLLTRSIAQASLPPSLIFAGPAGVGKRRAALATAQALNCPSPVIPNPQPRTPNPEPIFEIDACGTCPACRRIARGVHPDVQTIAPGETGTIKIEQVRDAVESAVYRPFDGTRRVFLVEEAEALVAPAQNALLKTLEEPRPSSVFILISAMADTLLPTVRSRCSHLRFGRLTAAEVASVLMRDHGYGESDARAVAALADGSVGRALEAQAAEYADARQVAIDLLTGASGGGDVRARLERAKPLTAKRGGAGAAAGSRADREQVAVHLQALSSVLRDVSILATGADTSLLANLDLESGLTTLARRFDSRRAVRAFTAVDQAQDALDRNVSPKIVADWVALQL
jgi:DNA polymerase-3 subunit delta'